MSTTQELARKLRDKYRQLQDDARRESQSLMVITDLHHNHEHEKMAAIGREMGMYSKSRVYKTVAHLLNRHLSTHERVHRSMEEILQSLENLAHRDDDVSVVGPLDKFIVYGEGDAILYSEVYEEIKREYESFLLKEGIQ